MVSIAGHFNWTHAVYFGLFAFIMPVYFLIFVCLLKLRTSDALFKTTFYAILLQHSLADIIAMALYAFQKISYILIPGFIYNNQAALASGKTPLPLISSTYLFSVFYNCFFWFIIIRSNGVALMTIHRYLIIVKSNSNFSLAIQQSRSFLVWTIYWIPAAFFDGILYSDSTVRFDSVENLKNVVKPETTLKSTIVCISFLSISCTVCVICYILIIKYIREKSSSMTKSLQRELRLAFQVSFPFGAQLVLLCFMIFANLYAKTGNTEMMVYIRDFFPLANGLLSFISPFTIILFNKDLTRRIRTMITGKKDPSPPRESIGSFS
ncbi:hypothetical protein CAEBREN_07918 [Caenorhabditis brenneri]|uniref:G-protein coupled receptors family 1 profile domain-containing protein n=1 Tax=Caenorhabditis brenneri TaxID=135651 RepID=G0NVY6_CAEBE|nr:hypothetical protein CAEBREN_07918 [Caenorhabditis brenneri]